MASPVVQSAGPPSAAGRTFTMRAMKMACLFSILFLISVAVGTFARGESFRHVADAKGLQELLQGPDAKALLFAAVFVTLVVGSLLVKRRGSHAFSAMMLLAGMCSIAASVAILAKERQDNAVVAHVAVPAVMTMLFAVMHSSVSRAWLRNAFEALGYIFWIPREPGQIIVRAYGNVLVFWPLVIAGFFLGPLCDSGWLGTEMAAWIWLGVLIVCILAAMPDFNLYHLLFVAAVCIIAPLGNYALLKAHGMDPLGDLYRYLAGMDVMYEGDLRQAAFLTGAAFIVLIPLSLAVTRMYRQHIVAEMTVRVFRFGLGTDAVAANAPNADSRYPNLVRVVILPFTGNVAVQDNEGRRDIHVIMNVPLLPFRIARIQETLRTRAVKEVMP